MVLKIVKYHSIFIIIIIIINIIDILRRTTTFSERHSLMKLVPDVPFNVACELSQPMGKTKFSSIAKNRTIE